MLWWAIEGTRQLCCREKEQCWDVNTVKDTLVLFHGNHIATVLSCSACNFWQGSGCPSILCRLEWSCPFRFGISVLSVFFPAHLHPWVGYFSVVLHLYDSPDYSWGVEAEPSCGSLRNLLDGCLPYVMFTFSPGACGPGLPCRCRASSLVTRSVRDSGELGCGWWGNQICVLW